MQDCSGVPYHGPRGQQRPSAIYETPVFGPLPEKESGKLTGVTEIAHAKAICSR